MNALPAAASSSRPVEEVLWDLGTSAGEARQAGTPARRSCLERRVDDRGKVREVVGRDVLGDASGPRQRWGG